MAKAPLFLILLWPMSRTSKEEFSFKPSLIDRAPSTPSLLPYKYKCLIDVDFFKNSLKWWASPTPKFNFSKFKIWTCSWYLGILEISLFLKFSCFEISQLEISMFLKFLYFLRISKRLKIYPLVFVILRFSISWKRPYSTPFW